MKFPTFVQTLLLVILWSFVLGLLGVPATVTGAGTTLAWLWFLYGAVTNGPGFTTSDILHPTRLANDVMA